MTARPPVAAERTVTLDVSLLGRDFKVACKESEHAELTDAVALLDRRMREIREGGKIAGVERIAVMAALNLAHDLLRERRDARAGAPVSAPSTAAQAAAPADVDDAGLRRRIAVMQSAIDQVLAGQSA
jgi:cell division protein ZapA